MNQQFIKVRSLKDIIIFSSFILVGFILTLLPYGMGVTLLGCTLILVGAVLAVVLKSAYREVNNPGIYYKRSFSLSLSIRRNLQRLLNTTQQILTLATRARVYLYASISTIAEYHRGLSFSSLSMFLMSTLP